MDQFPAKLLLCVFLTVELVVTRDVSVKSPHQNHSDHSGQKEDDHERVHDGEPLDVGVGDRVQDVVPAGGPLNFGFLERDNKAR